MSLIPLCWVFSRNRQSVLLLPFYCCVRACNQKHNKSVRFVCIKKIRTENGCGKKSYKNKIILDFLGLKNVFSLSFYMQIWSRLKCSIIQVRNRYIFASWKKMVASLTLFQEKTLRIKGSFIKAKPLFQVDSSHTLLGCHRITRRKDFSDILVGFSTLTKIVLQSWKLRKYPEVIICFWPSAGPS